MGGCMQSAGSPTSGSDSSEVNLQMAQRMGVEKKTRPPQRLEGGGFTIVDIMSGVDTKRLDPFLIWHELPRAFYKPGEMPGAPMHPHRGFCECPYAKEIVSKDGPGDLDVMRGCDHEGNKVQTKTGDFEFGLVGRGFEHEGLIDPRWTGYLHFFQLWINLPKAHKMDNPKIINCAASKLPIAEVCQNPRVTAKILLGENVFGATSPVKSPYVPAQYLDFEIAAGGQLIHTAPPEMETRLCYVYLGEPDIGGKRCSRGEFILLTQGSELEINAGGTDAGVLFIAGKRINEPVVQHGPFVMTSQEEIKKCFADYQRGALCGKMTREVIA
eukprot:gnl/MRDRNA2_/MRDRNA2_154949_c0_seq1.p1 gnl/MRDRNA2_/MRDRNA2_154949_c0~~gnl/MRDRNA2_/MRDRNA2_154949_c0_seq1.p1  ORF type:complete len:327 (-),score=44.80 gnl/MRDRNA2_/MRDRNA2_154949_c0_seq1:98-1078(-)